MTKPTIVDEKRWNALDERLTAAVEARPELAPVVELITRPVRHLMLMADETPGALGNDVLAAERLRLLLIGSSPAQALVPLAEAALRQTTADDRPSVMEPGLIATRTLALVALAAARVAPDAKSAIEMVHTVYGLALEASPVEMLVRLEPFGAPLDALDAIVRSLAPQYSLARAVPDFITQVMLDAIERGRWECLARLFASEAFGKSDAWDVSDADGIREIVSTAPSGSAKAGDAKTRLVTLRGRFPDLATAAAWPSDRAIVVASDESKVACVVGKSDIISFSQDSIVIRLPVSCRGGWVGFDRLSLHAKADDARARAIAAIQGIDLPCPMVGPAASQVIPFYGRTSDLPAMVHAVPPRTRSNGLPDAGPDVDVGSDEVPVDENGVALVTIVLFRPTMVEIDSGGEGLAPIAREMVESCAVASLHVRPRIVELPWMEDPLAVVPSGLSGGDDPRLVTLLEELSAAAARVPGLEHALFLLVLPGNGQVLAHAPAEAARAVAVCSAQTLGALLTRVFQDAIKDRQWVPGHAVELAPMKEDAAPGRLLAGSAVEGIVAPNSFVPSWISRLRETARGLVRPEATRLRLLGRLLPNGQIELEMPREDVHRSAGPGAPVDSGLSVVALSSSGSELVRSAIQVLRPGNSPHFAVLLPLSPEVATVEFRRGRTLLKRLVRFEEAPTIVRSPKEAAPRIRKGLLTWSLQRVSAARVEIGVEFLLDGIWSPLLTGVDGCLGEVRLPFQHIRAAERLRLVASEGWRTAVHEMDVPEDAEFGPLIVRRVSDRVFWADGAKSPGLSWEREVTGGAADGPLIKFTRPFAGSLALRLGSKGTGKILDKRIFRGDA